MIPFASSTVAALVAAAVIGSAVQPVGAADIPGSPYYGAPPDYGPPGEPEVYSLAPPPARYGYVPAPPRVYYPPSAVVVAPEPYYEPYYVRPRPVYVYPRYGAYPRYYAHGPYVARSQHHHYHRDWGHRRW